MTDPTIDIAVKKSMALQDRSFESMFPEQAALWKKLLANEISNFLPVGIALFNDNFALLNCNRQYRKYIRAYSSKPSGNVIGMDYFDLFSEAESSLLDIFRKVRTTHTQHTSFEHGVKVGNAEKPHRSYWDAKLIPVRDRYHCPVGLLLITREVTASVLVRNRMKEYRAEIRDLKTSLRTLMHLRQEDKSAWEKDSAMQLRQVIDPYMTDLGNDPLTRRQSAALLGIEQGIKGLENGFSQMKSKTGVDFTPKEIQVAAMIRCGKSTKEIADHFCVSPASIEFHRKNIRTKLKIKNKKINLQTFLTSCPDYIRGL